MFTSFPGKVTADVPVAPRKIADPKQHMITVQPLKRSEMQVSIFAVFVVRINSFCASLRTRRILELERYEIRLIAYPNSYMCMKVTHGVYGSLLQCLGSAVGFLGSIPCCPCPNPFRNVQQGALLQRRFTWLFLTVYSRIGGPRLSFRQVLQVSRSRACPSQRLYRIASHRGCKNPD